MTAARWLPRASALYLHQGRNSATTRGSSPPLQRLFTPNRNLRGKRELSQVRNVESRRPMTADECNRRACECAANAAIAPIESVSLEFLRLAAQWRAMAVRQIFLGDVGKTVGPSAPAPFG